MYVYDTHTRITTMTDTLITMMCSSSFEPLDSLSDINFPLQIVSRWTNPGSGKLKPV